MAANSKVVDLADVNKTKALDAALIAPARDAGLLRGVRRLLIVPQGILGWNSMVNSTVSRRFFFRPRLSGSAGRDPRLTTGRGHGVAMTCLQIDTFSPGRHTS